VDIAAAAKSTKEWKKSFLVFKELFEREKSFVNSWRKKIKEQTRELNDNLNYMDYDSKKEKEDALLENKREFERYVQDKNEEFSEKEKEMTSPILKKMMAVVKIIGIEKQATMITDKELADRDIPDWTSLATKTYDSMGTGFHESLSPALPEEFKQEADRLFRERELLEEEREKLEALRIDQENRKQNQEPGVKAAYSGTGFLFSSKDYVITNWHVIRGMKSIKVKFLNGEKINAKILLKDAENDIAFLKLEQSPQLPASEIRIGDSSKIRMGDEVFTIGYPAHQILGMNPKYTKGEVNALSGISDDPTVFQISVQIQPGNSGGPLFNSSGEVIGITQASLDPKVAMGTFGTLPQNVNYAIKSSYISSLLPMLPETMIASRGIVVVPADPENNLANFIDKVKKNIVLIEAKE